METTAKLKKKTGMPTSFSCMSAALPWIMDDAVIRLMSTRDLYDKYLPMCVKHITWESFMVIMTNNGIVAARRHVKQSLAPIMKRGKQRLREKVLTKTRQIVNKRADKIANRNSNIVERLADRIIDNKLAGAKLHKGRMMRHLNKIDCTLKAMPLSADSVEMFANVADKFDKMGRRLFDMDDGKELDKRQFNIAVLLGSDMVPMAQTQSTDEEDEVIDLEEGDLSEDQDLDESCEDTLVETA